MSEALGADEYAFLLNDSRARAVVAGEGAARPILSVRARCPWLAAVIAVGRRARGALDYERLLERASAELAAADTSRDDVALWGYTSGSTGAPKAAVHLHHDLVHAADLVGLGIFGIGPDDLVFSVSKLHFAFGLGNSLYFPARVGAASLLVPERPDPARVLALIERERPTALFAVPTMYARLLQVEGASTSPRSGSACRPARRCPPRCFTRGRRASASSCSTWWARRRRSTTSSRIGPARRGRARAARSSPASRRAWSTTRGAPCPRARGPSPRQGRLHLARVLEPPRAHQGHHARRLAAHRRHVLRGRRRLLLLLRPRRRHAEGGRHVGVAGRGRGLPARAPRRPRGRGDRPRGRRRPHAAPRVLRAQGRRGAGRRAPGRARATVKQRLAGYKAPRWIDFVADLPKTATGKIQRFRLRAGADGACASSSTGCPRPIATGAARSWPRSRTSPHGRARGVRRHPRPLGLRQVDAPRHHGRAPAGDRGRRSSSKASAGRASR